METYNNSTLISNNQTITSKDIAEITGKQHKDVLKAIRTMEPAWEETCGRKFALTYIDFKMPSGGIRKDTAYALTKTECLFVATKFKDEARAKLVLRWEQLEKERLQPQPSEEPDTTLPADPRNLSRLQILQIALQAEEENERLRAEKEELEADKYDLMVQQGEKDHQIQQLEQKTAYLELLDSTNETLNTTQVAQDYGMSAIAFNNLLKGLRIQYNSGGQWILYAPYLSCGYVANRQVEICHSNKKRTFKQLTVWTPKGRHFLYDKLKKNGILPLMERNQSKEGGRI